LNHRDLANNHFSSLPDEDIRTSVRHIDVSGVPSLVIFPDAFTENVKLSRNQTFPLLRTLNVTYSIHCCLYEDYELHVEDGGGGTVEVINESEIVNITNNISNISVLCKNYTLHNVPPELYVVCHPYLGRKRRELSIICPIRPTSVKKANGSFICHPHPSTDPFHPCYDIIEYTSLRVIIWFVISISLCGNVLVFTVLLYGAIRKSLTVPQLMILNLATADFCLGLYLLFMAAADLDTAGEYFNRWHEWERSAACKTAGFFAVLSSTASICILGLITFERMTTIVFTFSGKRFLTLVRTAVCLIVIWSVAFLFAVLPVDDTINSYSKASICLPIEASDLEDEIYIGFLLFFTGAVCFFILVCYVILFIRVKKTTSSLTARQEFKIALKMAALVATDFVIWLPIAVFGLAGVFGSDPIIELETSKYFLIFLFPLNSCINPVLYSLMQSGFRNQMCDVVAHTGLCKNYHKRRRDQRRGLSFAATNPSGNRFRLGSITSTTTFTSFMSLFSKRSSVASIGSNDCQLQQFNRKSTSSGSTSSDPQLLRESKFYIVFVINIIVQCTYLTVIAVVKHLLLLIKYRAAAKLTLLCFKTNFACIFLNF